MLLCTMYVQAHRLVITVRGYLYSLLKGGTHGAAAAKIRNDEESNGGYTLGVRTMPGAAVV